MLEKSALESLFTGEQGWCSGESSRLPPMWPGFDTWTWHHMWVEFVGSCPCSERFFSGYSGFPFSSKTNISKFQFDLDYCQVLYHEPLAWEIVQALLMLLTLNKLLSMATRLPLVINTVDTTKHFEMSVPVP